MPDRPAGRGHEMKSPAVIEYAKKHKIPYFQTPDINKDDKLLKIITDNKPDLFIVLAFAQFLSNEVLNIPHIGSFNIHTSLLPKYRGAAPIQYALLNGDQETGVSIQKMVKKMDAGDLAISQSIEISPWENTPLLYNRLKFLCALCLNDFLKSLIENTYSLTPQEESNLSFAPEIKKEMGHIKFTQLCSETILNKVRALHPWPGTYFFINDTRIKIHRVRAHNHETSLKPGHIKSIDKKLIIATKLGQLELLELQIEGKKKINGIQFAHWLNQNHPNIKLID